MKYQTTFEDLKVKYTKFVC